VRGLASVVMVALAAAGCGDDEENASSSGRATKASAPPKDVVAQIPGRPSLGEAQARGTYVGEAGADRGTAVAFVVQGDQVVVYVCDGKKRGNWFAGTVEDGRFRIQGDPRTLISGTVESRRITGVLALDGGARLGYSAVPAQDRPRTGLYVFDDPSSEGSKARWIVTEHVVRGVSSTAGGTTLNSVSVTTQSSGGDTRFAGVSQETSRLLATQQALAAELKAASSENVSLRNTLQSSGTTTTTTTKGR
jgi:hypothetical protein